MKEFFFAIHIDKDLTKLDSSNILEQVTQKHRLMFQNYQRTDHLLLYVKL